MKFMMMFGILYVIFYVFYNFSPVLGGVVASLLFLQIVKG